MEELEFGLHRQTRPDYFKELSESYSKAEFKEPLALPCPIAWLAVLDGQVVGLCFGKVELTPENLVCKPRRVAFIQDLVTLPEYRGRGIATALMAQAREQAMAEQAESVELCVWNFNDGATSLQGGRDTVYYTV